MSAELSYQPQHDPRKALLWVLAAVGVLILNYCQNINL